MQHRFTSVQIRLAIAALIATVMVGSALTVRAQIDSSVPPVTESCIDRSSPFAAGGAELMATATVEGTEYYLIYTYEDSPDAAQYPSALLVSAASGTCDVALWNTPGDFLAYADYVPFEAAVKFREIQFSRRLDRMGREAFITAFDLSELALLDEEAAALERLAVLEDIRRSQS